MIKQTDIQGKDSALDDSIATLQQKILNAGFNIVEQLSVNPVVNVWSIAIHDRDCSLFFSEGHGVSKKAALVCALSKFIAHLSTHYFWSDYYLGGEVANSKFVHHPKESWFDTNTNGSWPDDVLNDELCDFYNPDGELNASTLIDVSSSNNERGICCLPFQCINTGEMINFPVNIIDNLYASNGMSTGSSIEEARLNALSQIVEYYIQFKIIAEGISLPDVPIEILNRYPTIQASIKGIEIAGYSLSVKDASLGGKYPVIAMTLVNPNNQGVKVCFGAHPQFGDALEFSLTQLLQGLNLDHTDEFAEAGFDMDEISSPNNLENLYLNSNGIVAWSFLNDKADYEFVDWDSEVSNSEALDNSTEAKFKQLCDLVHAEGNDIFISDFDEIGVYTCRIIIPSMSEIYPIDDLVWENNNAGIGIRGQILKADKTSEDCEQLIIDLEDINQDDELLVSTLIGMPADQNSIFNDLRIAELITLLSLKVQDNERIQEGCEWLLHYKNINPCRLKTYQCINTILQLDMMTNYGAALAKLYTSPILSDALALIDGEDIFPLISDWEVNDLLLEGYKKVIGD